MIQGHWPEVLTHRRSVARVLTRIPKDDALIVNVFNKNAYLLQYHLQHKLLFPLMQFILVCATWVWALMAVLVPWVAIPRVLNFSAHMGNLWDLCLSRQAPLTTITPWRLPLDPTARSPMIVRLSSHAKGHNKTLISLYCRPPYLVSHLTRDQIVLVVDLLPKTIFACHQ